MFRSLVSLKYGSSLQAQGTPKPFIKIICHRRFIPAGAGNTNTRMHKKGRITVHPCRRREHTRKALTTTKHYGSSLQAQGTPHNPPPPASSGRFIPAGAGNTAFVNGVDTLFTVHPCRRREHGTPSARRAAQCGSSLQAQGTHYSLLYSYKQERFIPAGAGNTI